MCVDAEKKDFFCITGLQMCQLNILHTASLGSIDASFLNRGHLDLGPLNLGPFDLGPLNISLFDLSNIYLFLFDRFLFDLGPLPSRPWPSC
jgi:hypothetical protein